MLNARNYTNPKINEFYHKNFAVSTTDETVTVILCIEGAEFIVQNINGTGSDKTMTVKVSDEVKKELENGYTVKLAPFTEFNLSEGENSRDFIDKMLRIKMEYMHKNFEDYPDVCKLSIIDMDLPETDMALGNIVVAELHKEVYAQIIDASMFNIGMTTMSKIEDTVHFTQRIIGVGYDSAILDGVDEPN